MYIFLKALESVKKEKENKSKQQQQNNPLSPTP